MRNKYRILSLSQFSTKFLDTVSTLLMSLFSSSARYACHLKVCICSFHKFQWIFCILEFLRGSFTIYLLSSTLSLTFSLHVDFYKAKARLIDMRTSWISSSPARGYWSRIGVLTRVMWLPPSESVNKVNPIFSLSTYSLNIFRRFPS